MENLIFLLQQSSKFSQFSSRQESNPIVGWVVLGIVVLILAIVIMNSFFSLTQTRQKKKGQVHFNNRVFGNLARSVGLVKNETGYLSKLIHLCKVKQPYLIFTNSQLLDDVLKKGLYATQHNDKLTIDQKDARLATIFNIKQKIEMNSKRQLGIKTTHLIKRSQKLILLFKELGYVYAFLKKNLQSFLVVSMKAKHFERTKVRNGMPIKIYFWRDNDAGYTFQSRITDIALREEEIELKLQHSDRLSRAQKRLYRRVPIQSTVFIYTISIHQIGKEQKAVVDKNSHYLGYIKNISAGGLALRCNVSLAKGDFVKLEFDFGKSKKVVAFGKIVRIHSPVPKTTEVFIKFTKINLHARNLIYEYVYNYQPSVEVL